MVMKLIGMQEKLSKLATQSELSRKPFPMLFLLVRFMCSNRFCVDEAATFELSVVKVESKLHVKFTVAYELNLKIRVLRP